MIATPDSYIMKLREEILKEHTRKQCDMIAAWVCTNKSHFNQLMKLLLNDTAVVGLINGLREA